MPRRISKIIEVSAETLKATGAFNGFVDIDSNLYVDPHLLSSSLMPELKSARQLFEAHFSMGNFIPLRDFTHDADR